MLRAHMWTALQTNMEPREVAVLNKVGGRALGSALFLGGGFGDGTRAAGRCSP